MSRTEALEARFAQIARIHEAIAILHWDQAVIMPAGSIATRAEQLATLNELAHGLLISAETGALIAEIDDRGTEDEFGAANYRLIRRAYKRATALDPIFVAHRARVCAHAEVAWREARSTNKYDIFLPHLERVLDVVRQEATILAEALDLAPYDALLDEYQPGLRERSIAPLLEELSRALPQRVDTAIAANPSFVRQTRAIPASEQKAVFHALISRLGFDFNRGRLDESTHPFCGGVYADHRMTTRYDPSDVTSGLMGVLHETGHALYEMGLPADWIAQPVGQSHGMLVHESQSLLIEMQLCRSPAFLSFLSTLLGDAFGDDPGWRVNNLRAGYRHVARTLIRVDADELTYPLHIIHRYRLERALLSGDLKPAELPGAWNELMNDIVGVRPQNDAEGCLQDIHWAKGIFGYFPCYTLGALLAAQLARSLRRDIGDFEPYLERGDFDDVTAWLRQRIHSRGSALELDELILESTGKPLGTADFLAHLDRRYLDVARH